MNELAGLWIPIVVSAFSVLIVNGIVSCVVRFHLPNWKELPEEDATVEFLQKSGISPGVYLFPGRRKRSAGESEESRLQRMESGPWGTISIMSQPPDLGRMMMQASTFFLVINILIAHLAIQALGPADGFITVFRFTGSTAALAYAAGGIPNAIWHGGNFRTALVDVIQGIVLGIVTGAVFATLWPT
ncbi:MAG: hypothetical protein U0936_15920 [Planctomycetaceae bacterium]